jgi:hypothetical protein
MAEKIRLAERVHPLYDDNVDLWELYLNSVKGGLNFANSDNVFTHRLENTEDYDAREERLYYLNYSEAIPRLYNTYIFKERVERPPDSILEPFRTNTDRRGTSIAEFVNKVGFYSSVFGAMHVLVDMPVVTKTKMTRADAKKANLQPYCSLIYPSQLKDWSFDSQGNLRWIVIESTYYNDADPNVEREEETHYKLITTEEWRIEDEDGKPVKFDDGAPNKGKNELGRVPLVTVYHRDLDDDKVGESMLKDIVYINRIILNWCSCIDEQIERNTFSQLIYPDDGTLAESSESGDDPVKKIGTSCIFTFPSDSGQPPQYISPDTANIEVIWNLVIDHIKEIYRIAGLIGSSEDMYVSRSGRAAQMGFLGVNSALAEKAKKYEKFENDICGLAYELLGKDTAAYSRVTYSSSFDVTSLQEEIDTTFKIMEKNMSETLNKTMMKNVARKAIPLAPADIREQVEQEIESGTGIIESSSKGEGQETSPSSDDGDGNPNSNSGKTFRTKGQLRDEEIDKEKKTK